MSKFSEQCNWTWCHLLLFIFPQCYLQFFNYCCHQSHLKFIHRFDGVAPEPREGVRSGHIPGAKCVQFPEVGIVPISLLDNIYLDNHKRLEYDNASLLPNDWWCTNASPCRKSYVRNLSKHVWNLFRLTVQVWNTKLIMAFSMKGSK